MLSKKDYKGHPCYAVFRDCPCKPCYNCHDCNPPNPAHSKKVYSDIFHCATNWNKGCPQPIPESQHTLNRQHKCIHCGSYVDRSNTNYTPKANWFNERKFNGKYYNQSLISLDKQACIHLAKEYRRNHLLARVVPFRRYYWAVYVYEEIRL